MRIVSGVAIVALVLSVACGSKSGTANTTPQPAPAGGAQAGGARAGGAPAGGAAAGGAAAPRSGGPGAQAAARMTTEQLSAAMKTIASTAAALRMKLMNNQLPDAAKDAQTLAMTFGDVERFWQQNNKPDAVMLAQTARQGATDAAGAAAAGDAMKAQMAAANMQGTCKQCHGLYREGDAQTGYRVKAGVLTQ